MNPILEQLDKIATENKINLYTVCVADENGIETLKRIHANPCQDSYSVAKFFCVTAIGMLCDEGKLKTSDTVGEIFADEIKAYGIDANKWSKVTLDNVMRHEIGFGTKNFLDIDVFNVNDYPTDDLLRLFLEEPLVTEAGTERLYTDAAYYLTSRIVTKISGERLDDFLMDRLFSKIGCREVAWSKCPHKYPYGATGLYIRTEDMIKLGVIYLNGGTWQGERIISQKWIDTVLERGYELRKFHNGYSKGGMRGQRLYVNFDKKFVVAWHAYEGGIPVDPLFEIL